MMFSTEMLVLIRVLVHFQQCNPTMTVLRGASADIGYLGFASKISAVLSNATAAVDADASNVVFGISVPNLHLVQLFQILIS